MWLYHGTYDMYYKEIKASRLIIPCKHSEKFTKMLDKIINQRAGMVLRGKCVYLSDDIEVMDGFDRYFRISTTRLDINRLFVADNSQLDYIIAYIGTEECKNYIDKYIKSYITYKEYLRNKEAYNKQYVPEFIYFGKIGIGGGGKPRQRYDKYGNSLIIKLVYNL